MGSNRFMDGLMLGAIIGGTAVFLLGTKKGNKILKILTEEGIEGLNRLAEYEVNRKETSSTQTSIIEDKIDGFVEESEVSKPSLESEKKSQRKFFKKK